MSNFTVRGVYPYTSVNTYAYLGRVPASSRKLEEAFREFGVTPTGQTDDLKKLDRAMYAEYSEQVKEQMANQNSEKAVPWASVCARIGVQATGDYNTDLAAFNNAINLLSQSAIDGQAMAFFAGIKSEASQVFSQKPSDAVQQIVSFETYKAQYLS